MSTQMKGYWKQGAMNFFDSAGNTGFRNGVWASCPILAIMCDPSLGLYHYEDFLVCPGDLAIGGTVTADGYTLVGDASSTAAIADAANGVMVVTASGTNNNEAYLMTNDEIVLPATGKPMWFEARLALTEANTDDANWIIGIGEAPAANHILDNGGGPAASYDGIVFFKVDGTMSIYAESSTGGTQSTSAALTTFVSATWFRVGFYYDGATSVYPYVNDVVGSALTWTASGFGESKVFMGVKAGDANAEALRVDYWRLAQLR